MGQHQHARLFIGQIKIFAILPHGGDPAKERLVARDFREMRRQLGRESTLQIFAHRVAVGPGHCKENTQHLVQRLAGSLQRLDRIGKSGGACVVGNRVYFGIVCRQRFFQRGGEIFVADLVKGGDGVGGVPICEQWICHACSPLRSS